MPALLFGSNPDLWVPRKGDRPLDGWPATANAGSIKNEMLPATPFVLFDQDSHLVQEMGLLVQDQNRASEMGWSGEAWKKSGWKVDPTSRRSFTKNGYWVPLVSLGLMNQRDLWFPLPDIAYAQRAEQKLYRRNPQAVLTDEAYRACQLALRVALLKAA